MQSQLLLYPFLTYVLWVVVLYVLLTLVRAPEVWGVGGLSSGENPLSKFEPRISANLSNQFEWPILFYVIITLLISTQAVVSPFYFWSAWLFVVGRVVHSGVQVLTTNIRLRGVVFTVNFAAVLMIWLVYFAEST